VRRDEEDVRQREDREEDDRHRRQQCEEAHGRPLGDAAADLRQPRSDSVSPLSFLKWRSEAHSVNDAPAKTISCSGYLW